MYISLRKILKNWAKLPMIAIIGTDIGTGSVIGAGIGAGLAAFIATPAIASDAVALSRGQAKVFRISRPAGTVIIGNPEILVANLQDNETLVLTGRKHGTTNMIVLDQNGEAILDRLIVVEENEDSTVRVYSQGAVSTFACNESCNPIKTQ